MMFIGIVGMLLGIALMVLGPIFGSLSGSGFLIGVGITLGIIVETAAIILLCGLKVLNPNEAYVFTVFGKYYGTLKKPGFFWVNPFLQVLLILL